ncbi:BrnT family toxin [Acidisoma cladoniae]|jgi:uncharacterized DUF497 family protein|uniref:BrnT family toxin n=1 Tax=Acidisoma cladoniae TaxID=3040935 RepID=UPI00254FFBCA|nr:BrnT family toxin [Acidisoma sp. PAMC 29798]
MAGIRFEWDEAKSRSNQRKHGLSFEEASQVFNDPMHFSVLDRIEGHEYRWRTLGLIGGFMILMVAHTMTETDAEGDSIDVIRIISARRADRMERRRYENENG